MFGQIDTLRGIPTVPVGYSFREIRVSRIDDIQIAQSITHVFVHDFQSVSIVSVSGLLSDNNPILCLISSAESRAGTTSLLTPGKLYP